MLAISKDQKNGFKKEVRQQFHAEVEKHLRRLSPKHYQAFGDQGVKKVIDEGLAQTKKLGIKKSGAVRFIIEILFLYGLDFFRKYPDAAKAMADPKVDDLEKTDQLHQVLVNNPPPPSYQPPGSSTGNNATAGGNPDQASASAGDKPSGQNSDNQNGGNQTVNAAAQPTGSQNQGKPSKNGKPSKSDLIKDAAKKQLENSARDAATDALQNAAGGGIKAGLAAAAAGAITPGDGGALQAPPLDMEPQLRPEMQAWKDAKIEFSAKSLTEQEYLDSLKSQAPQPPPLDFEPELSGDMAAWKDAKIEYSSKAITEQEYVESLKQQAAAEQAYVREQATGFQPDSLPSSSANGMGHLSVAPEADSGSGIDPYKAHKSELVKDPQIEQPVKQTIAPEAVGAPAQEGTLAPAGGGGGEDGNPLEQLQQQDPTSALEEAANQAGDQSGQAVSELDQRQQLLQSAGENPGGQAQNPAQLKSLQQKAQQAGNQTQDSQNLGGQNQRNQNQGNQNQQNQPQGGQTGAQNQTPKNQTQPNQTGNNSRPGPSSANLPEGQATGASASKSTANTPQATGQGSAPAQGNQAQGGSENPHGGSPGTQNTGQQSNQTAPQNVTSTGGETTTSGTQPGRETTNIATQEKVSLEPPNSKPQAASAPAPQKTGWQDKLKNAIDEEKQKLKQSFKRDNLKKAAEKRLESEARDQGEQLILGALAGGGGFDPKQNAKTYLDKFNKIVMSSDKDINGYRILQDGEIVWEDPNFPGPSFLPTKKALDDATYRELSKSLDNFKKAAKSRPDLDPRGFRLGLDGTVKWKKPGKEQLQAIEQPSALFNYTGSNKFDGDLSKFVDHVNERIAEGEVDPRGLVAQPDGGIGWVNPDLPADSPWREMTITSGEPIDEAAFKELDAKVKHLSKTIEENPHLDPKGFRLTPQGDVVWVDPESGNKLPVQEGLRKPSTRPGASEEWDAVTQACPKVCPSMIRVRNNGTPFGYDDGYDQIWISVEKGKTATFATEMKPADKFSSVEFKSNDELVGSVSPPKAGSANQSVEVTGKDRGETYVELSCNGTRIKKVNIATYEKIQKTVAVRLVHCKDKQSTDVSDAAIQSHLNELFGQAAVDFKVSRIGPKTVEFDDFGLSTTDDWTNSEVQKVIDACKDDSFDYNVFLLNSNTGSIPGRRAGFTIKNQRYCIVHPNVATEPPNTTAHELGHCAFGLRHEDSDPENLMYPESGPERKRLRKHQWDQINPGGDDF